jgi:hypothetical protein
MAKQPDLIRDYVRIHKISTQGWQIRENGGLLVIAAIPDRSRAEELEKFLTSRGMLVTLILGDKQAQTWRVMARSPGRPYRPRRGTSKSSKPHVRKGRPANGSRAST